jgi:hypothetical protein
MIYVECGGKKIRTMLLDPQYPTSVRSKVMNQESVFSSRSYLDVSKCLSSLKGFYYSFSRSQKRRVLGL